MAKAKTEDVAEDGEQGFIWPDLGESPEHKALFRQAKKFWKAKNQRDEVKTTMKAEEDAENDELVKLMHAADIKAFRHKGIEVKLLPGREKANVKIKPDDGEEAE